MVDHVVIQGQVLRGSGDRELCIEQCQRLRQLAKEIEGDLARWQPQPGGEAVADHVRAEVVERIQRHRTDADAFADAVRQFDTRAYTLTPGEAASLRRTA